MEKHLYEALLVSNGFIYDENELQEMLKPFKRVNKMSKVILFSRVSTEIQSLESQTEELKNEALRAGYKESDFILIEQKESAVKLDTEERIGLQKLKDNINSNNNIDCVIIYEISRLSRRPKVLFEIRDYLIEHNIQLICLKPYMKLMENGQMSNTASLLFSLFGTLAEQEAKLSKERMSRGKKHKQAMGGYIGGKPLFGYTFENDVLVVDYSKSEIVKKIYNMYESGFSTVSIAKELMQTGELKQTILNNANRQVQNIVTRPEYCGGKSKISGYHYPSIITKTQFDNCRQIAKNKSKEHKQVKRNCLCKRLLYFNGHLLSPNIAKKQYKLDLIDRSMNATIRIDNMDKMVWDALIEYVNSHGEDETTKAQLQQESNIALRKIQQAKRNISDLDKQIDRIETRIIEGKMSEIKGDGLIKERQLQIKEQQDIMDKNNYIYEQKNEALYEESYKIDFDNLDDLERQNLVRKYIDKVELEKIGDKRGHYKVVIIFKDNTTTTYRYWSSGPWNNIERIE